MSKRYLPRDPKELIIYLDEFKKFDSKYNLELKKINELQLKYKPEIDQLKICKKNLRTLQLIKKRRSIVNGFEQSFSDNKEELKDLKQNDVAYSTATEESDSKFEQFISAEKQLLKIEEKTIRDLWVFFLSTVTTFSQTNDSIMGLNRDYLPVDALFKFYKCFSTIPAEKLVEITESGIDFLMDRLSKLEKTAEAWQNLLNTRMDSFLKLKHFHLLSDRLNKVQAKDDIESFRTMIIQYSNLARDLEYISVRGEILLVKIMRSDNQDNVNDTDHDDRLTNFTLEIKDENDFFIWDEKGEEKRLKKEDLDSKLVSHLQLPTTKKAWVLFEEHIKFLGQSKSPIYNDSFYKELKSIAKKKVDEISTAYIKPFFLKRGTADCLCNKQSQYFLEQIKQLEKKIDAEKRHQIDSLVVATNSHRLECQFYLMKAEPGDYGIYKNTYIFVVQEKPLLFYVNSVAKKKTLTIRNPLEFKTIVTSIETHNTESLQERAPKEIVLKLQNIICENGDKYALDYDPIDHFVELINELSHDNIQNELNTKFEEIQALDMDTVEHRHDLFAKISAMGELQKSLPRTEKEGEARLIDWRDLMEHLNDNRILAERFRGVITHQEIKPCLVAVMNDLQAYKNSYTLCLMSASKVDDDTKIKPRKVYIRKYANSLEYAVFCVDTNKVERSFISKDQLPELSAPLEANKFEKIELKECQHFITKIFQITSGKGHTHKDGAAQDIPSLRQMLKIMTGKSSFQQKIQKVQKFLAEQKDLKSNETMVEYVKEQAKKKIAKKIGTVVRYFPLISESHFELYQKRCRKSSLFSKSIFNDLLEQPEFIDYIKLSFKLRMCFMTFKDIRGKLAHDKPVEADIIDSAFNDLNESVDELPTFPISPTIWSKIDRWKVVSKPTSKVVTTAYYHSESPWK